MSRHSDALAIQSGACNPIAIVNALGKGMDELRVNGLPPTDTILQDPALRLIVHQLAFLFQANDDQIADSYAALVGICEALTKDEKERVPAPPGTAVVEQYTIDPDFVC